MSEWSPEERAQVDAIFSDFRTLLVRVVDVSVSLRTQRDELASLLRESLQMTGHNHWDHTMGHGAGCPLCITQREISSRIREALKNLPAPVAEGEPSK